MLALKNQYLREMGVDVWVLRKDPSRDPAPTPAVAQTPASAVAAPAVTRQSTADVVVPEFHFCFMTFQRVSLVFSVPREASMLPDPLRRFGDDLALALAGDTQPRVSALQWPMVKSAHIDQSPDTARAVVQQRIDKCAPALVLFGDSVAAFVDDQTRPRLQVEEIASYLSDPLSKRALWQRISTFKGEIS